MTKDTPDDDQVHLDRILYLVKKELRRKYTRGQHEHGGHLWRKPVLQESIAEVLDLVVYLYTLRDQIDSAQNELTGYYNMVGGPDNVPGCITRAYNILTCGNPEGESL